MLPNIRLGRYARRIRLGRHARRWATVAVIVVIAAGGGATAWAMTSPSGPSYRTATVARANVTQTLTSTGTIEPVSQANVSFPVSGQVASVSAKLGSHVTTGQVLAQLSTTSLASQVSSAQYTVATDTVRLASDKASQTTTSTSTSSTSTSTGSSSGTSTGSGTGGTSSTAKALAAIAKQQATVLAAQKGLDGQLTSAKSLLATETTLCAGIATPTPSPTLPSSSATPTSTATTSSSSPPVGGSPSTCQQAITQLLSAQTSISASEQSLANSESALTKALGNLATALSKSAGSGSSGSGSSGSGSSGSGSSGSGSSGSGSGGSGSGSSGSGGSGSTGTAASSEQLASDQANLDAANAQLTEAKQNLAAATLVAPISGTVVQVNITTGEQVGSSSTANFVIDGPGGEEATTTVSASDVGQIKVGQPASISLDGSTTSISGTVVAIGVLSSSSSTASYPVTIGLDAGAPTLFAGSNATVSITLAKVSNVVTVPTSAITSLGTVSFVTVLRAGKATSVRVSVGATSPVRSQVTSGLTVGEQVVLADTSTPLPTNSNPFATRGLTSGGGGFGGGPPGGVTRTGGGAGG